MVRGDTTGRRRYDRDSIARRPAGRSLMKVEALLVDDDARQLDALAEVVQLEGFACRTAASLGEARDRLAERTPDVIISDLMLPDGNGLELREHPTAADTEMVLITGQASVDSAIQALRTGVLDYITKP